ncbi:DNA-formamidopyrimidine glycosylase family protein [Patulibacter sp.]|uniref:DNA-formamidopyrimidine glycosylase family protein n=1 Tax=Patulibacter sp. TaxID=1912859 RepID=UPI002725FEB1|nr:DNA-formamidopyrimidine glycosylase family protein [Patulibacter sp.]MDO9408633.1 DNA-formamidopyrimidine glycosylase family protein [Patulibacter sp.]
MPELPEVEITARLLSAALQGATVDSARAPGLATMQTFKPPLDALAGSTLTGIERRGKMLLVRFAGGGLVTDDDPDGRAVLLVHLMSAGRLQLFEKRATMKDRTARIVVRLQGGADGFDGERELRLKEFGTRQSAWGRLLREADLEADERLSTLGPEAWPDPPDLSILPPRRTLRGALRDQRVIAGVGRRWADEVLWEAKIAPLRRAGDLDDDERAALREAIRMRLDEAIAGYAETLKLPLKDKMPVPERVHGRAGEACPRCGDTILAVHYESDEMAYCPTCQTGGKPYKDRRFSRLLKD